MTVTRKVLYTSVGGFISQPMFHLCAETPCPECDISISETTYYDDGTHETKFLRRSERTAP